jgi:hypothetical protein
MDEQRNEEVAKIEQIENDLRVLGFDLSLVVLNGADHLWSAEVATALRDIARVAEQMADAVEGA